MKKRSLFTVFFSFAVILELLSGTPKVFAEDLPYDALCLQNSLSAEYYRISGITADIANVPASDSVLRRADQKILASNDAISSFDLPQIDQRRFPDGDTLPGSPRYFAAHWRGSIVVPKDGEYRVTLSSHEASQLFINGAEAISVAPNDSLGGRSQMMHFASGTSTVDIYFAKRSDFRSGLNFKIEGVVFRSCAPRVVSAVIAATNTPSAIVPVSAPSLNNMPRIEYFNPPTEASANKYYAYKVLGADPDGNALSYELIASPKGMTIATSSGLLLWKPTSDQTSQGPYSVIVRVSDGISAATSRFEIHVKIPVTNSALSQNTINDNVSGNMSSKLALPVSEENISIAVESRKETPAPTGSRLSASVLFTGVFTMGHWIVSRLWLLAYFIISLVLTGFVIYALLEIIDRKKRSIVGDRFAAVPANIPLAPQSEHV